MIKHSKLMQKTSEPVVNANDITRIAGGASIKGDLSSPTDIRIDGNIDGKVYSGGRVVVGGDGQSFRSPDVQQSRSLGEDGGEIYVKDTVSIKSTSVINGNLHVRKLQVEIGAQINGSCRMISEQEYDKKVAQLTETARPAAAAVPSAAAPKSHA